MMYVYIAMLVVLGVIIIVGQVSYVRALERSGVVVPTFVRVWRMVNLSLLGGVLVAVVIYLFMRS